MKKLRSSVYAAVVMAVLAFCLPAFAEEEEQVNALLVIPTSEMSFDRKFQDFLAKNGAKLLKSYPPSVFEGYIPQDLDKELGELYGVMVYREKVDDWGSFAKYGEKAFQMLMTPAALARKEPKLVQELLQIVEENDLGPGGFLPPEPRRRRRK